MLLLILFGIFIFMFSFITMIVFLLKKKKLVKTNIGMAVGLLMFLIGFYMFPGDVPNEEISKSSEEVKTITKEENIEKKEQEDKIVIKTAIKDNKKIKKEVKEIEKSSTKTKESEKTVAGSSSLSTSDDNAQKQLDYQLKGEENALKYPAVQGAILYDKNEAKYQGMDYYFIGKVVKIKPIEDLQHNFKDAYLVKNEDGYIIAIFPPWGMNISENDNIEAWGMLSGDGYSSKDLGVDNVVGLTGALNALSISVDGEIQY